MISRQTLVALAAGLAAGLSTYCISQTPVHYEPTLDSLNRHPLPAWYAHAKLGIFVCWGPYSVPGWAPLSHPDHDFDSTGFIVNNPYAEWYYNVMRIDGSPTQAYHRDHYGANFDYYNFVPIFDHESAKWDPEQWARLFRQSGARYVVLTVGEKSLVIHAVRRGGRSQRLNQVRREPVPLGSGDNGCLAPTALPLRYAGQPLVPPEQGRTDAIPITWNAMPAPTGVELLHVGSRLEIEAGTVALDEDPGRGRGYRLPAAPRPVN